ncbi:hypothetical protein SERLADRAFT_443783 [Serpula lacrymans var. lacrymans S7.9]|uniref:Uncharacterized protein n=1 Tax=Serpula lacrymans var. lacrymans (strain S7.9) TaxID=578457 RepID=F8PDJ2_SERL9|nr:uncharacterized protein SERLADRAFT_443783 [Serpula lacrymans var. lacrymans S7.9]EGO18813.1 hypothetical protein SERLADRAFT_443783 [Serpula lacrymans var. lacrymans S7.9]
MHPDPLKLEDVFRLYISKDPDCGLFQLHWLIESGELVMLNKMLTLKQAFKSIFTLPSSVHGKGNEGASSNSICQHKSSWAMKGYVASPLGMKHVKPCVIAPIVNNSDSDPPSQNQDIYIAHQEYDQLPDFHPDNDSDEENILHVQTTYPNSDSGDNWHQDNLPVQLSDADTDTMSNSQSDSDSDDNVSEDQDFIP